MTRKTKAIVIVVCIACVVISFFVFAMTDGIDIALMTLAVFGPPILTGLLFVAFLIMFLGKRIDNEEGGSTKDGKRIKVYGVMALIYGAIFAATVVYTVMQFT